MSEILALAFVLGFTMGGLGASSYWLRSIKRLESAVEERVVAFNQLNAECITMLRERERDLIRQRHDIHVAVERDLADADNPIVLDHKPDDDKSEKLCPMGPMGCFNDEGALAPSGPSNRCEVCGRLLQRSVEVKKEGKTDGKG